ncbi:MAG: hypothetical protein DMG07_13605 [Acidobacteria bacterium]|nr:MAG: hypothetical protein DMG07_13605 [Acidobacteriota bacterium]
MKRSLIIATVLFGVVGRVSPQVEQLPPNRWVELRHDAVGARRASAIRYAPAAAAFFLWGFMNADPGLLQEQSAVESPEYDMVFFDPGEGRWRNHLPKRYEAAWGRKLPMSTLPRTYSGITTGSERILLRGGTAQAEGVPRPDLNLVFDQVTYHAPTRSLVFFTGGLTAAYDVLERRWTDLEPRRSPPPVLGGSLAHDPVNDEIVLAGGGNVAEAGPNGRIVGYTSTWVYRFRDHDWQRLVLRVEPPPRMNTRLVTDPKNGVLVLFGGDGQSHYLADTWRYDLRTRAWSQSKSGTAPEARAGHFTVYDPENGWVIVGGGHNRRDLTDMWAYDAGRDRWQRLAGDVPVGFYLSADLDPKRRLIVLATSTRTPGDRASCNVLYPVRTTYGYRIDGQPIVTSPSQGERPAPIAKRAPAEARESAGDERARREQQAKRLAGLPLNQWTLLSDPGRTAPARTWGTATFDSARSLILYWGGGHCGYGGSDVDAYDVAAHTWRSGADAPEYPERSWDMGVRLAGVTFQGNPWTEHGRKIYAFDPVSSRMIMVRPIRLTTGYDPAPPARFPAFTVPTSYLRYATWSYDPATARWEIVAPAPVGLDTLVTTRRGVMGVNVHWQTRLNDAGYILPWSPRQAPADTALYLFRSDLGRWERLSGTGASPQNLYEMTSLAYDSRRDRVILHGAGQRQDELWTFDLKSSVWTNAKPPVAAPEGAVPPVCAREAVYIPGQDVFLTYGPAPEDRTLGAVWVYRPGENAWRRADIPQVTGIEAARRASQNRALVYDPKRDLVLLVLGGGGDAGITLVYAMRYSHAHATFISRSR